MGTDFKEFTFWKEWEKLQTKTYFENLHKEVDPNNENVKLWNKLRDED